MKYAVLCVLVITGAAVNMFWSRREAANFLCQGEDSKSVAAPSFVLALLGIGQENRRVSPFGMLFFQIIFLPSLAAGVVAIVMALAGLAGSIFGAGAELISPVTMAVLAASVLGYYTAGYLVFRLIAAIRNGASEGFSSLRGRLSQLPGYVWIFAAACLPIPVVTGNVFTIITCLAGIIVCITVASAIMQKEGSLPPKTRTAILVYALAVITAAAWGMSYLLIEILSSQRL